MKATIIALIAICIGAASGVIASAVRFQEHGADMATLSAYLEKPSADREAGSPGPMLASGPRAVIPAAERTHDFGFMTFNERSTHEFVVRNGGDEPLELTFGYLSCRKCTTASMEANETVVIEPGDSHTIELTWYARTSADTFRQGARLTTNDPDNKVIDLVITGKVDRSLRIEPPYLVLPGIPAGEPHEFRAELLSTHSDQIGIEQVEWENQEIAHYFQVLNRPIEQERIETEQQATSGQYLRIMIAPGMPLGPFEQALIVESDDPEAEPVQLEITGTIIGPVSVVGSSWNEQRGYITLGDIDGSQGGKASVFIKMVGDEALDFEARVAKVSPDFLKVTLGEPLLKEEGPHSSARVRLTVEVPPGTPTASHRGTAQGPLGEILLETNHPLARQFKLGVKFLVLNSNVGAEE